MDRVILADGCFQEDTCGTDRPNDNQIIVGGTGCGKTMSCLMPTLLNTNDSSMIATFSKPEEVGKLSSYMEKKGYKTQIIDLINPMRSTVFYDPMKYIETELDIRNLADSLIEPDVNRTHIDPYWVNAARSLFTAVAEAQFLDNGKAAKMTDVLHMLERLIVYPESERRNDAARYREFMKRNSYRELTKEEILPIYNSCHRLWDNTNADFHEWAEKYGEDWAPYCKFRDYEQLPDKTASCVRSEVVVDVDEFFPAEIRKAMDALPLADFRRIGLEKTALFIIVSPVNSSTYAFANLIMQTAIKELLECAMEQPGGRLPVTVKLLFDDFACGATIRNFARQISIFRASGISAMLLLQSESQLRGMYGQEDTVSIINNCATYVYFFGGRDISTCRSLSELTNMTVDQIVSTPVGKVLVMLPGQAPRILPRYDVYKSTEYLEYTARIENIRDKTYGISREEDTLENVEYDVH